MAMKLIPLLFVLLALFAWALPASGVGDGVAATAGKPKHPGASGLATPRFVSLASATVHMRAGPGVRYPITWVYKRRGTPFMVMAEHEYWRKVRDIEGTEGWMHRSLLSGWRTAVLRAGVTELRRSPDAKSPVVLRAEAGVIGKLLTCEKAWCQMDLADTNAWLPRAAIFGALPNERF